jgi:hypothetical protein
MGSRLLAATACLVASCAAAADFAMPGGPEPANVAEVARTLAANGAGMELMLSFGTSKGGSAGHLALALRDDTTGEERVHSANFYADRDPKHARDYYTDALIVSVPKMEYLYGTRSSLGEKASFGLDYGEVYKRTVVGVRVFGVPAEDRAAIAAYLERMNRDFEARAHDTPYQRGEVKYGYMDLNCAKTIGSAFKYGAHYEAIQIRTAPHLDIRKAKKALNANTPSEMALQIMRELDAIGYPMDVVLYRKYPGSPYVDPHEENAIAFRDLPNRFPSAISLDFRNDAGAYQDYDNLYAMYLLRNMLRYAIRVDGPTQALVVDGPRPAMKYATASGAAAHDAEADSKGFLRRLFFKPHGERIDEARDASAAPSH